MGRRSLKFLGLVSLMLLVSCGQNKNQTDNGLDGLPDAFISPIKGPGDYWLEDSAKNLIDGFVLREGYELAIGYEHDPDQFADSCLDERGALAPGLIEYIIKQLEIDTGIFYAAFSDQNIYRSHILLQKRNVGLSRLTSFFNFGSKESVHFNCKLSTEVKLSETSGFSPVRASVAGFLSKVFRRAEKELFNIHLVHVNYLGIRFKGPVGAQVIDSARFWREHEFRYEQITSSTLQSFIGITNKFMEATKIYEETLQDWEAYIESYNERDQRLFRTLAPLRAATDIKRYSEIKLLIRQIKGLLQFALDTRPDDEILESDLGLMFGVERTDRLEVEWELERMRRRYARRAPVGSSLATLLSVMETDSKDLLRQNLMKLKNQLQTGDEAGSLPARVVPQAAPDVFFYHQILPQKLKLVDDLLTALN